MNLATAIFALVVSVQSVAGLAGQRGPSTAAERARAVKLAKVLETYPLDKDAAKARQWLTLWLVEVPDITVEACSAYLGPAGEKKYKYSAELSTQMMFASAAFKIEHPGEAEDRVAVNLAGLEGALRTYAAILAAEPKARHEFLDQLVVKQQASELRAYVENVSNTACR